MLFVVCVGSISLDLFSIFLILFDFSGFCVIFDFSGFFVIVDFSIVFCVFNVAAAALELVCYDI